MKDLIERLEAATGPDRRLDAEIACAVKFPHLRPAKPDDHKEHLNDIPPGAGHIWCSTGFLMADSYTSSIDAALTLVPEGVDAEIYRDGTDPKCGCAVVGNGSIPDGFAPRAANPALALCIAALKARCLVPSPQSGGAE